MVHGARFWIERAVSGSYGSIHPIYFIFAQQTSTNAIQYSIRFHRFSFVRYNFWLERLAFGLRAAVAIYGACSWIECAAASAYNGASDLCHFFFCEWTSMQTAYYTII